MSAHRRRSDSLLWRGQEHRSAVRRAHLPDLLAEEIPFHREFADLGVSFFLPADAGVECAGGVVQQLLLPGLNPVGMDP